MKDIFSQKRTLDVMSVCSTLKVTTNNFCKQYGNKRLTSVSKKCVLTMWHVHSNSVSTLHTLMIILVTLFLA